MGIVGKNRGSKILGGIQVLSGLEVTGDAEVNGDIEIGGDAEITGNLETTGTVTVPDGVFAAEKLVNPPTHDTGYPGQIVLNVSGDTIDGETVTIDDDIYVVRLVATDSNEDAANNDFDNTDDPLVVTGAIAGYAAVTFEEGDLIRLTDEVMEILEVGTSDVTLKRAVSGTTAAAHANGVDIYQHATPASPGADEIFVGVVDVDADTFTEALTGDINHPTRAQGTFYAENPEDAEVVAFTADDRGGNIVANADAIVVAEAGVNFDIEARDGVLAGARQIAYRTYVVQTEEAALGDIRIAFPFDVGGFVLDCYDASGVPLDPLTSEVTIRGNFIEIDDTGGTHLSDTDIVRVIAWA